MVRASRQHQEAKEGLGKGDERGYLGGLSSGQPTGHPVTSCDGLVSFKVLVETNCDYG